VLTGDSLFVGDVARPDLAIDRDDGAREIYRSLHERILELPPETEVWPGHLGGSLCGGPGMDMKVASTIGFERRSNELLHEDDEDRFVERAVGSLGPQPPNFQAIVDRNRGPLVREASDAHPLTPRQLDQQRDKGALIVDVRTDLQFDDAHLPESVCIPAVRAGFGTKLAWIADPDQEVAFVGRDDAEGMRAVELAGSVGVTKVAGYLSGGMTSWREEKRRVERIERVTVAELRERSERDRELQILDVREDSEWKTAHIPGSVHIPYHDIEGLPPALNPAQPVAAICASGERSAVAASLVQRYGASQVLHVVDGGVGSWARQGWPIEEPRKTAA
jgi:hydroxyacylglutathione hydrolase